VTLDFLEALQLFLDGKKVRCKAGWVYWPQGNKFYAFDPNTNEVLEHENLSEYLVEVLTMYDVLGDWEIINDD